MTETAIQIDSPIKKASSPVQEHQKVFFPNLDALRFICFFLVFLFHCYKTLFEGLSKSGTEADNIFYGIVRFLFQHGELGVNFFFVLSGFLITFLLIREKEFTGRVHLGNFYIRRVLRIWPMFYLCIFIGFVIVPLLKQFSGQSPDEIARPLYYVLFLNNFDYISGWPDFPDALILIVLWSVAVEEQFYLVWPVLLKSVNKKWYPFVFSLIILGTLVFRFFHTGATEKEHAILQFHTLAVIGDMALGALFAYYCSYQNAFLDFVKNLRKWQIAFIYLGAISMLLFRHLLFTQSIGLVIERLIIAFFFGFVILEQNFSQGSFIKFSRFKTLSKLGLYTYGLYCLHFFIISLVQGAFNKAGVGTGSILTSMTASILALLAAIIICKWSFRYFEKPFLKMKDRFAFIRRS